MIKGLSSFLSFPSAYRLFTRAVGGDRAWRSYLTEYVKPVAGEKVLDLGCGPGDVLNYLTAVNYTGLDISAEYINAAKARFGDRGRFLCADVGMATLEQERGTFNLVMANGVLHHLDDGRAAKLFHLAHLALRPDGRLITYDGCYTPEQSKIAWWLLGEDRGKFVRTQTEYLHLASGGFGKVESNLRHDLLRMPYTHVIMRCSN